MPSPDSTRPRGGETRMAQLARAGAVESAVLAEELRLTSAFAASYERTVSWRVTAPLRALQPAVRSAVAMLQARGRSAAKSPDLCEDIDGRPRQTPEGAPATSPAWQALGRRVLVASTVLLPTRALDAAEPSTTTSLLADLLQAAPSRPGPYHWLVMAAVQGRFPLADDVRALARAAELGDPVDVAGAVLAEYAATIRGEAHRPHPDMMIVDDRVVVDVDYCAGHDTHTGIQRVVREVLPIWAAAHPVLAVAHTARGTGYRPLDEPERQRVFAHGTSHTAPATRGPVDDEPAPTFVVPWSTTVVLPDVMNPRGVDALAALAEFSGNTVSLVGYDMIPILSAELRPLDEAALFAAYLVLVKHAHRVAAISCSAAQEFRGFAAMLPSQGLRGPTVVEVALADRTADPLPSPSLRPGRPSGRPIVLAVGRREPHKNLATVLQAAELLWVDNLDFELVLVGGLGWVDAGVKPVEERLIAEGRPLTSLGWVTEQRMAQELQRADVTVFVSLHEGYGLQVAESLACGTPVITSDYGSQREIADAGGCLTVDPRDEHAVAAAIRRVLTEPGLAERLRADIARRPGRTWREYAEQAWSFLVDGTAGSGA